MYEDELDGTGMGFWISMAAVVLIIIIMKAAF